MIISSRPEPWFQVNCRKCPLFLQEAHFLFTRIWARSLGSFSVIDFPLFCTDFWGNHGLFFELFLPSFIMLMAILRLSIRSSKIDLTCFVFRSFNINKSFLFFKKLSFFFLHCLLRQSWLNISSMFGSICFQIHICYHILSCLFFLCQKFLFCCIQQKVSHYYDIFFSPRV